MGAFHYKALRDDGTITTGQLDVGGRQEALRQLSRQGLQLLALEEGAVASPSTGFSLARKGVSSKVLETFTRQLSSLLAAGVPLSQALHLLAHEDEVGPQRSRWQALHEDVIDGCSLAQAMNNQPTVFPHVYSAMVKAGETGGFLDLVLRQIAGFQNRDRELRSKAYGAMIYPAVLATLSLAVLIFLMVFFIPRFQGIFSDFGAALPPLTRLIVNASLLLKSYGIFLLAAIVALIVGSRQFLASHRGRLWKERRILRLPVIGRVASQFAMTRFCRLLGTLTQAGVPLISALRVAREAIGNQILSDAVDAAVDRVQHGDRLGDSLATCPMLFSRSTVAMISVAEQSGRLAEELLRIADDAEQELDRRLRVAVALAEPALLFVMAAFVGLIVIGMVLPIFAIQDYIQ